MRNFLSRTGRRKAWRFLTLLAFTMGASLARTSAWGQEQKAGSKANGSEGPSSQPKESAAKPADDSPAGNIDNGKKLFMSNGCFECHGTVGQGSTSTGGARLGPPAISFDDMVQYVHHPSGQMPPYTSKVISDHDLADIYAYLKSQPKAQPGKNIPLLNQ
jgi:mono/diheme cytochrome c family protein